MCAFSFSILKFLSRIPCGLCPGVPAGSVDDSLWFLSRTDRLRTEVSRRVCLRTACLRTDVLLRACLQTVAMYPAIPMTDVSRTSCGAFHPACNRAGM